MTSQYACKSLPWLHPERCLTLRQVDWLAEMESRIARGIFIDSRALASVYELRERKYHPPSEKPEAA
jgi:hypothetical protein